ncbi:uncharacterized protein DNG_03590 [Cephalotrichum gorgonifer]|uniref:Uncharacterized protein n=1 Tax=Cephalotrichum gorgonifer TaxID=2041049 RepID=A0AAE8MWI3_9PEZI|nr:uncharacterized protein DNG_03590 [Cephalotrichum gorgonifer]
MLPLAKLAALLPLLASQCMAQSFTISNGQIFTPGFAIVNAPQPGTPLGGDDLHISLDVTANGRLNLPPYVEDSPSQIRNISVFLYSYTTGRNFTVAHPSQGNDSAALGDIMAQEDGSTVKHINWKWPDCLIGDGQPRDLDSDRGIYNISIRQNFRLNDEDHYTIFDLPISVTNRIEDLGGDRPSCDELDNDMIALEDIDAASANAVGVLFAPGDSTQVEAVFPEDDPENGLGGSRREGTPADGLGGAGSLDWRGAARWACLAALAGALTL